MKRRTLTTAALAALLVAALGAGVAFFVWVYPWLAGPPEPDDELARRWDQVERWAAVPGSCGMELASLRSVLKGDSRDWRDVRERSEDALAGKADFDPDLYDAWLGESVAALLRWPEPGAAPPRQPPGPCDNGLDALQLLGLGEAALVSGPGPRSERVAAALNLARTLRRCGSLLQAVVGFKLAELALDAEQRRAEPDWEPLRSYAPAQEEIFGIMAREAVCSHRLVVDKLSEGPGPTLRHWSAPPGAASLVSMERELAMLRSYFTGLLHGAEPARGDAANLADALERDFEALPPSFLVRMMAIDAARFARQMGEVAERYETLPDDAR